MEGELGKERTGGNFVEAQNVNLPEEKSGKRGLIRKLPDYSKEK